MARSGYYYKEIENPGVDSPLNIGKTIIKFDEDTIDSNSDIYALAVERVVSITPLSNDLTSRVNFSDLQVAYEI